MTENKLKVEILETNNHSLMGEKVNLTRELKDARALFKAYEQKYSET